MVGVQPLEWRPTLRVYQHPNLTYLSAMVKESGETVPSLLSRTLGLCEFFTFTIKPTL